jgi:predicted nucleotidyltransferase
MTLSEAEIARIARRIVERIAPLAVGVFGSYGVGTAKPGSDLDLVVIGGTKLIPPSQRRRAVLAALRGIFHPVDAHVFTPEEFETEAQEYLSFAWVIARQVRLYYALPDALDRVPSLRLGNGWTTTPVNSTDRSSPMSAISQRPNAVIPLVNSPD